MREGEHPLLRVERLLLCGDVKGALDLFDGPPLPVSESPLLSYWRSYLDGALRRAVIDGDVETGSVMAGQSVGMVTREQPTAEIIAELVGEAEAALERRS